MSWLVKLLEWIAARLTARQPPSVAAEELLVVAGATDKWQNIAEFLERRLKTQDDKIAECQRKHEQDQQEKWRLQSEITQLKGRVKQLEEEVRHLRGEEHE